MSVGDGEANEPGDGIEKNGSSADNNNSGENVSGTVRVFLLLLLVSFMLINCARV